MGPTSTKTATARKLGKVASAPCATSSRWVWIQATIPTRQARPHNDRQASDGHLLELADHFTQAMNNRDREPSRTSG